MPIPNLLFIYTDEQAMRTLAAYGNRRIAMPNLDRLAAGATVFERCYVTQPVCTLSRSTLLTGLYPHTNGCTENNVRLPAAVPGPDQPLKARLLHEHYENELYHLAADPGETRNLARDPAIPDPNPGARGAWGRQDWIDPAVFRHPLFDVARDPGQAHPLDDPALERRMAPMMARLMKENDCPPEQFVRLGLDAEGAKK